MQIREIQTFTRSIFGNAVQHHPKFLARGVNFIYHAFTNRFSFENRKGVDIFSEDWDTLIILDACRYDVFSALSDLPGQLESRESKGTSTVEFLEANFSNKNLQDTVYVTANPQYYNNQNRINADFCDVKEVWMEEGWNKETGTVLPETVTKAACKAHEEYPEKKLIIHYIQPHFPFIGSEIGVDSFEHDSDELNIWEKLFSGEVSLEPEAVKKAYRSNLEIALPHVNDLVEKLDGRTVVTSDHGNLLGEPAAPLPIAEWGHPRGIYVNQLTRVPWLVVEGEVRREVTKGSKMNNRSGSNSVEERLRQLGYVSN